MPILNKVNQNCIISFMVKHQEDDEKKWQEKSVRYVNTSFCQPPTWKYNNS